MSVLGRVLWRDILHLRGQLLAAALVVACGIGALVATQGTYRSLLDARDGYYRSHRFAEVFASLVRAPEALAERVRAIPGVTRADTRIVAQVQADVPALAEPATLKLVSVPDDPVPVLNDLQLLQGRRPAAGAMAEVLISEAFARANGLRVGDSLGALLHGRWSRLVVSGIALSPEFVYEVGPGGLFPDNRRFGVAWMRREALAAAFDMRGAFNDLALTLNASADLPDTLAELDRLLRPYGGVGAYGREEQLSHRFLTDELGELGVMTTTVPSLFLGVAAFLLYVALSRLVAMQRTQVGLLKAFGHTDFRVGVHYLGFAVAAVALGLSLGVPLGVVLGRSFVDLYREFFRFPALAFSLDPGLLATTAGVGLLAAAAGALAAVRRVVRLAPAESMRPEPPLSYDAGVFAGQRWARGLPASLRMILRNVVRRPWRALASILGIGAAIGLMVLGRFAMDAPRYMLDTQFEQVMRDDVTVVYDGKRGPDATRAIARMDGVLRAEPFRVAPVWLRHAHRGKRGEITGLPSDGELRRLIAQDGSVVPVPSQGLVLGEKLARILRVSPGDTVTVEVLEGARAVLSVPVVAVVDEMIGLGAYMEAGALARLLGEDRTVSGARLRLAGDAAQEFHARLKRVPAVAGVVVREALRRSMEDSMNRAFFFFSGILVGFACVIIAGMVYNSARIALSERGNELASLAVLGFTNREVGVLLLGEQALLLLVAIPVGLLLGYGMCALMVPMFDRDLFRVPLVIARVSYLYPIAAALAAAALSGWLVARRVRRLDLIAVLKTRE